MNRLLIGLFLLTLPSTAWAFVPHEYSAIYIHQIGRVFYLFSMIAVLWTIIRKRLHKEKGWRYFFIAVVFFSIWDLTVFFGRFGDLVISGPAEGWDYFRRTVALEGFGFFFYLARMDFWILDIAMLFFYLSLREHLKKVETGRLYAAAVLPFFPILFTDMAGNLVYIVLATLCLKGSLKLYRRDKENVLWNYMVWLAVSYFVYSISRSFGHVIRHILLPVGLQDIWSYFDPISGSLNTVLFFWAGFVSLFFIQMYQIYMKITGEERELELVNLDLTELNQELETLVAERTMSLMGLTVADRVRNPAALIGCACKRIVDKEKKLGEDMHDILTECKKLESIVGDFEGLLRSRRSMFKYEDVNGIVNGVISVLDKEIAGKRIRISLALSAQPLRINMQKNLLRAAFYHVIRNSIDATSEGGAISVSTSQDQEQIVVTVSDTGMGIPQEDIDRIFDPFFTTKKSRFGMGLPLVRQIMSEHLGEIKVKSEVGKGTTFRLSFPVRWMEKKQSPDQATT